MKHGGISGLMDTQFKTTHEEFHDYKKPKISQFINIKNIFDNIV